MKAYSEDVIVHSIRYEKCHSTEHGNKLLDQAFLDSKRDGYNIYLLFSVIGSSHFCGVAHMTSSVNYSPFSRRFLQGELRNVFSLKWIYLKDVPNTELVHIRLENNDNISVTDSSDTQEKYLAK